jgi:hypothetical protein
MAEGEALLGSDAEMLERSDPGSSDDGGSSFDSEEHDSGLWGCGGGGVGGNSH